MTVSQVLSSALIVSISPCHPAGQRFVDDVVSYLEEARVLWPWLLGAAILGALCSAVMVVGLVKAPKFVWQRRRRQQSSERQPLIISTDTEGSSSSYKTMRPWVMWALGGISVSKNGAVIDVGTRWWQCLFRCSYSPCTSKILSWRPTAAQFCVFMHLGHISWRRCPSWATWVLVDQEKHKMSLVAL